MTKRLRRVGPLKFGIVSGAVYALISLIFIPVLILAAVIGAFAPNQHSDATPQGMNIGIMVMFAILAPIIYGILGFLFGALAAAIYNLVAKLTGGIEFEVD